MFVYIKPVEFSKKVKKIIYPQRVEISNTYYYSQILPIIKGEPQWQGLVYSGKLLVPKNIAPPFNVSCFGGLEWRLALIAEKLKFMLKKEKCDLIFCDSEGNFGNIAAALAPYANKTAILTRSVAYYENLRETVYSQIGCYMQINSLLGLRCGYSFSVSNKEYIIPQGFKLISHNFLGSNDIVLPQNYSNFIPNGVLKCDFAEALYSACGVGELKEYINYN